MLLLSYPFSEANYDRMNLDIWKNHRILKIHLQLFIYLFIFWMFALAQGVSCNVALWMLS